MIIKLPYSTLKSLLSNTGVLTRKMAMGFYRLIFGVRSTDFFCTIFESPLTKSLSCWQLCCLLEYLLFIIWFSQIPNPESPWWLWKLPFSIHKSLSQYLKLWQSLSVLDDYENSLFNSQGPLWVSLRAKFPNGNLKSFHHNFPDFKRVSVNIYSNFKDMFSFGPAHNITFTNFAIEGVLCSISFTSDLG